MLRVYPSDLVVARNLVPVGAEVVEDVVQPPPHHLVAHRLRRVTHCTGPDRGRHTRDTWPDLGCLTRGTRPDIGRNITFEYKS